MKEVRIHQFGGPEVLVYEDVPDPVAGPGTAVVKIEAIGINYAEVSARKGTSVARFNPPFNCGGEAAGTVLSVGKGVTEFTPGDRVAYNGVRGAYAEQAVVPADRLIPIPAKVTTRQAAASMIQGMTAHYLAVDTYPITTGETCLVHAAAGGVGIFLCQMAKMRGARVIGTVSSDAKAKAAHEAGCDETINYTTQDFVAETKRITDGRGVDVIYDGVGATTLIPGLQCIRPRGMMASYGQTSGPIPAVDTNLLTTNGSLYLTRTTMGSYTSTRPELLQRAAEVLGWVGSGAVKVWVHAEYPLREAGKGQSALEDRENIGKVLLIP